MAIFDNGCGDVKHPNNTVGTGGDSHTRFPIGISFPAASAQLVFAAAIGVMPLDMPESVLARFKGEMQPGITLRDLVNAILLYAIKAGLLTLHELRPDSGVRRAGGDGRDVISISAKISGRP